MSTTPLEAVNAEDPGSEGAVAPLEGNSPLLLDDPGAAWIVVRGHVDVFAVAVDGGRPAGARHYAFGADPGDALFGIDPGPAGGGLGLLAVGDAGTQVRKVPVTALRQRAAEASADVARMLDAWITAVAGAAAGTAPPAADVQIAPGTSVTLKDDACARPQHDVVWISVRSGEVLFLDGETAGTDGRPFPLPGSAWLRSRGASQLVAWPTADLVSHDAAWQALAAYGACVLRALRRAVDAATAAEAERLRRMRALDAAARGRALEELAAVIEPVRVAARAPEGGDPLLAACRLVGDALGVDIRRPSATDGEDRRDPLVLIARASHVRLRRVTLRGRWWREEGGPLLASSRDGHRPLALLPRPGGRYELVDPGAGTRTRVDAATAAAVGAEAYKLYRPFPDRAVGALDLLRFGLHGCRGDLTRVAVAGAALGLLATLIPIATGVLFNSIIPQSEESRLVQLTAVLALNALAVALLQVGRSIAVTRIEAKMDASVQAAVWDRLLRVPTSFFRDYSAGDLANRAMGIDTIRELLTSTTIGAILASVFSIFSLALLFYYDARLALLAVALTLVALAASIAATYVQLGHQRRLTEIRGTISGLVLQLLTGISKLRVSGTEGRAFAEWAALFARQKRASFSAQTAVNVYGVFGVTWPVLTTAALFGAVAAGAPAATLSTGTFLAFMTAFVQFLAGVLMMGTALNSVLTCVPLYERARPILRALPEVDAAKADPGVLSGLIEISHVSFRYRSDLPLVLHDVSFRVEAGEFVALVGASGAGKSSLFRLLLGFESPEAGSIYFDGQDLAGLDTEAVRRQLGVVSQDSKITPGSILANIIGTARLTEDDAWEAARLAGIDEDIRRMPMGMRTYISEGGSTFSGGQLQRLMIARAIVSRPRILLFDEATSALDNQTQAVVSRSLESFKATRIAIAHRLSTIQDADRILVIQAGRIVQSGTYRELVDAPGPFAELAKRQLA